jgi:hypothetical protein
MTIVVLSLKPSGARLRDELRSNVNREEGCRRIEAIDTYMRCAAAYAA